jgi:hypothetical protein
MMLPGEDKKNTSKDKVLGVGAMFRFSAAKLLSEAKEKEKVKDKDADLPHRHTLDKNGSLYDPAGTES